MPKIVTFGTSEYNSAILRMERSAPQHFDFEAINPMQLDLLWAHFPNHFISKRGYGWWLWKPFIIEYALSTIDENDYLIYLDSTIEIIKNPLNLVLLDEDIILFNNGQNHHEYCKAECYYGMGMYSPPTQLQANAGIQIYKNCEFSRYFIKEYFDWCTKLELINDNLIEEIQIPKFKEHRHDQSILTNLAVKNNIDLRTSPCQWGMKDKAFFNHHRTL
jgi:hypothetical protein